MQREGVIFRAIIILMMAGGCASVFSRGAPPRIAVYDTTCSCSTPSNRIFDCRFLTRRISRRAFPRGMRRTGPVLYRRAARTVISEYLDSTGYFHPQWDSAPAGPLSVIPGTRSTIGSERIITLRPPAPDSSDLPAAPPYPRPFDAAIVKDRAGEIGRSYTGCGYPFVSVAADLQTNRHDTIGLTFHIDPDEEYLFSRPELKGSFTTKNKLILRDLSIKPGARFDHRAIDQSLERLQTRNYITAAAALPPVIAASADSSAPPARRIIVPFVINDRSGMGLDGAAGLEVGSGDRPQVHGNIQFAFTNLFHSGEEAQLSYAGDRSRQRLDIGFSQPWFFGLPLVVDAGGGLEVVSEAYGYLFGDLGLFYEPAVRWRAGVNLNGHTVSQDARAAGENGSFAGADLVLARSPEPYRDGAWCRELTIATGSGLTRKGRLYNRSHIDFTAGGHLPFPFHTALMLRVNSGHLITRENALVPSELYRVGGNGSLRGYMENEFAFRTVVYGQAEYLYYFQPGTPVYLFFDGGIGFENDIGLNRSYRKMWGYGIGIRIPAGIGMLSVEWARNIQDIKSMGRIHVGFKNSFAAASKTVPSFIGR
ncbi:MAG: BamA/TamA family outer membrane protein [Chitinispirillaceae bacterium]|nr:BamA/TamA family outer membrane protein [Chitinispirillaceae bacterium]